MRIQQKFVDVYKEKTTRDTDENDLLGKKRVKDFKQKK